jgi:hypothetical protein
MYQLLHGFYGRDTLGHGKNNVLELPAPTWFLWERHSWVWKERCLVGGKSDDLELLAPMWLLWERKSWRWKERRLGHGNNDGKRVKYITIATIL